MGGVVLPWWETTESLKEADIGKEEEITVNGQIHKVRLIDIDHDNLADGSGTAHTTWEFVNLLSDSDGYSIATFWNRGPDTLTNYDYLNSSIYKCLEGQGSDGIYWYRKDSATTVASSDPHYQKTVLQMLPSDLQAVLKQVKKSVGIGSEYAETSYDCKLFNLSAIEMGYSDQYDKGFGKKYSYYSSAAEKTEAIRIKQQVKGTDGAVTSGTKVEDSGYNSSKNWAGYNLSTVGNGGNYWLRSPSSDSTGGAWCCLDIGHLNGHYVYNSAFGIAPAFCI